MSNLLANEKSIHEGFMKAHSQALTAFGVTANIKELVSDFNQRDTSPDRAEVSLVHLNGADETTLTSIEFSCKNPRELKVTAELIGTALCRAITEAKDVADIDGDELKLRALNVLSGGSANVSAELPA